jgi:hypothetical protein
MAVRHGEKVSSPQERLRSAGLLNAFSFEIFLQAQLRHQVSRRILRMNKRLEHETGEWLFEKRGWKWALTRFALDI